MTAWRDQPVTTLRCDDGATAVITDHGAHLVSWQPAGQAEVLFMSQASSFAAGAAIRGGVPIIFPQFAERGPGEKHGFARNCHWQPVPPVPSALPGSAAQASYVLTNADLISPWSSRFRLAYAVSVEGAVLTMALSVTNTDVRSWSFHAALHTYLQLSDISTATLVGLEGHTFHDKVFAGRIAQQTQTDLMLVGELDRIYGQVHSPLQLHDGRRTIHIAQDGDGFSDAVVWNPGSEKARAIADLSPGAENHFVCVEAGAILQAIELAPGAQWTGRQILRVQPTL